MALSLLLLLPLGGRAAEYVQIGVFANDKQSQLVRQQLERDGFPVVERLVAISDKRAAVLVLVGPFERVDQARYQLNKLREKGWKGQHRRFDEDLRPSLREEPPVAALEPPKPTKRRELEWPPEMVEPLPPPVQSAKTKAAEPPPARVAKPEVTGPPAVEAVAKPKVIAPPPAQIIAKPEIAEAPPPQIEEGGEQVAVVAPRVGVPLPGVPLPERPSIEPEAAPLPEKERKTEYRWSGYVALEGRYFPEEALYPLQESSTASLVLQPELYTAWNGGDSSITFTPFLRAGDADDERNHADIRELMWLNVFDSWEMRLGVGRVFWGVTESQHLVDVINQIDQVENPDGEDKLGQPMLNISRSSDWGSFDLFIMPWFRERTFPGEAGRLRGPLLIDTSQTLYESPDGDRHLDWAVRWSHYFGSLDIGLSHFSGTSRIPTFRLAMNGAGQPVLAPYYPLLDQTGLSLQMISGDWTWKLEAVSVERMKQRHFAMTSGFEYTYVGLFDTQIDLGMLAEYLYDDRGEFTPLDLAPTPYSNDLMAGLRFVFNDMQGSEMLMGMIYDLDGNATSLSLEASRRLGNNWKLALEYRGNSGVKPEEPLLYPIRKDDYLQLELFRYF